MPVRGRVASARSAPIAATLRRIKDRDDAADRLWRRLLPPQRRAGEEQLSLLAEALIEAALQAARTPVSPRGRCRSGRPCRRLCGDRPRAAGRREMRLSGRLELLLVHDADRIDRSGRKCRRRSISSASPKCSCDCSPKATGQSRTVLLVALTLARQPFPIASAHRR